MIATMFASCRNKIVETAMVHRKRRVLLTTSVKAIVKAALSGLLVAASLNCGDTGTGNDDRSDLEPPTAVVEIEGPSSVSLDCSLSGFTKYSSSVTQTAGYVYRRLWEVDGSVQDEDGRNLKVDFPAPDDYTIVLKVYSKTDDVLMGADTLVVTASPPQNPSECIVAPHIDGRWGVLIRSAESSTSASYVVHAAPAVEDLVTGYVWRLRKGVRDYGEILSGRYADSVSITFSEPAEYTVSVDQIFGEDTVSSSLDVRVREGEPLAEPGKILIIDRTDFGGVTRMRFMDGETGFLSESVYGRDDVGLAAGVCTDERVVFQMGSRNAINVSMYSIFDIGLDGSGLRLLAELEGIEIDPDVWGDQVVFVGDNRLNHRGYEMAIYDYRTDESHYLAGDDLDPFFLGESPTFAGSNDKLLVGGVDFPGADRRLAVYTRQDNGWSRRLLHHFSMQQAYGASMAAEGYGGIAWDPRNELVAYMVSTSEKESPSLAVAALDGSFVKILADDAFGGVSFTPSGSHILFNYLNKDAMSDDGSTYSLDVVMIPRDGGEIVDLSRAAASPSQLLDHSTGGYCIARR